MRPFFHYNIAKSIGSDENAEHCMDRLRIMAAECKYKELDRCLKVIHQHFEWWWYDGGNHHRSYLKNSPGQKGTNCNVRQFNGNLRFQSNKITENRTKSKEKYIGKTKQTDRYCSLSSRPQQCSTYGKTYGECNKIINFLVVYESNDYRGGTAH